MDQESLFRVLVLFALLLGAAHAMGRLFARFRLPSVIGEIVGGLLLGPTLLGVVAPGAQSWLFQSSGPAADALQLASQLGSILLMFMAGSEMRSVFCRRDARAVTVIAVVGMVLPFLLAGLLVQAVDAAPFYGPARDATAFTLVVACSVAVTSIPVISRIMLDLGIIRTAFARIVLSVAVLEDVVLNVLISVALGMADQGKADGFGAAALLGVGAGGESAAYHAVASVCFLGLVALVGRRLGPRGAAADRTRPGVLSSAGVSVLLVLVLAVAGLCVFLGIAPVFGAFAVGLCVSFGRGDQDSPAVRTVRGFASGFFIPMYFAIVGLKLDLVAHFAPVLVVGFLVFACAVKALSVYGGARLAGHARSGSVNLAVAMNARGGPGIVMATLAYDAQIVSPEVFTALILNAVVTSLLAGIWLERAVALGDPLGSDERPAPAPTDTADLVTSGRERRR
ncbi:cation:proton antiporter [Streptomyces sp. NPDC054766]